MRFDECAFPAVFTVRLGTVNEVRVGAKDSSSQCATGSLPLATTALRELTTCPLIATVLSPAVGAREGQRRVRVPHRGRRVEADREHLVPRRERCSSRSGWSATTGPFMSANAVDTPIDAWPVTRVSSPSFVTVTSMNCCRAGGRRVVEHDRVGVDRELGDAAGAGELAPRTTRRRRRLRSAAARSSRRRADGSKRDVDLEGIVAVLEPVVRRRARSARSRCCEPDRKVAAPESEPVPTFVDRERVLGARVEPERAEVEARRGDQQDRLDRLRERSLQLQLRLRRDVDGRASGSRCSGSATLELALRERRLRSRRSRPAPRTP